MSPAAPDHATPYSPPSVLARAFCGVYLLLIVYACLYPLRGWHYTGLPLFDYLTAPKPKYFDNADFVFNVLGYIPLGFLLIAALPRMRHYWLPVLLATLIAGLLSFSLETVQNFLPTRVSSNIDIAANLAGGLIGALAGAVFAHRLFDPERGFQHWRSGHIVPGYIGEGGLILLSLWVFGQATPDDTLFGSGNLRRLFDIDPILAFDADLFIALETALSVTTLVGVGLMARCIMVRPAQWPVGLLFLLAIASKAVATTVFYTPPSPTIWLTPGAERGLIGGVLLFAFCTLLPRALQYAVSGICLLAATVIINLLPNNPYLPPLAPQGTFLNLHGIVDMIDTFWPFAALAYLVLLGLRFNSHLQNGGNAPQSGAEARPMNFIRKNRG